MPAQRCTTVLGRNAGRICGVVVILRNHVEIIQE
jgi:hypothetical protein